MKKITDFIPKQEDRVVIGDMEVGIMKNSTGKDNRIWVEITDEEGGEFHGKAVKELSDLMKDWFFKYF